MNRISATIILLNEEANIGDCLKSLDWVDEIIVSDTGSTDSTVEICKAHGATVYSDDWLGFGKQKNLCQSRARNEWVFNIDADERVTPKLKEEMLQAVEGGKDGYFIPRMNHFAGIWVKHCGWYPDYTLRLYKKSAGSFNERKVHEAVQLTGPIGYLKNPLVHLTYKSLADYHARSERYSTLAADEMRAQARRAKRTDTLLRPLFTFFKMYFLNLGFLDGALGFRLSTLYAGYTRAKYRKLKELERKG